MRGRQVLMDTLAAHGVERIFGNPGTTESPLLDSLSSYPSIRYVTALHEGVATCAASYYAQATGKTGVVSLHVAPGLGNAIGMMYGALRAQSPMIVTAGQQDTRMRLEDPILGHDLVAMAAPVTKWSVQVERADEMASIMRRAFKVAHDGPPGPVFVALPIDVMEQETEFGAGAPAQLFRTPPPDAAAIEAIAEMLIEAKNPALLLGDTAARAGATPDLVRLAELLGAPVWQERFRMRCAFPTDHPLARPRIGLDAEQAGKALAEHDAILMIGGHFFEDVWHSGAPLFPAGARLAGLEASPDRLARYVDIGLGAVGDIASGVAALVERVEKDGGAGFRDAAASRNARLAERKRAEQGAQQARAEKTWNNDPISVARAMAEIRDALPTGVAVVDESITASADLAATIPFGGPEDWFGARGGGIGQGLAGAIGIKEAMPDRPVACISGDGSAMYSLQALWTAAHMDLPIVFIILGNGEYRVLKHNIDAFRQRFDAPSQEPYPHMDLGLPRLGFQEMAAGMGVEGACVEEPEGIAPAIREAFASGRPRLVEIRIEGRREVPVRNF